ncbi:MAG: GxxExxY protein [Fidelibacterota bacterium]
MRLIEEELTEQIISAAIEVHRAQGPGLLESAYEECFCHELDLRRLRFARQIILPVKYKNIALDIGYRIDVIVEDKVIVELKAVQTVLPVHEAQLLTYMKLKQIRVGLLLNFHEPALKDGIVRRVL